MRFQFESLTDDDSRAIDGWRYEDPYSFYNLAGGAGDSGGFLRAIGETQRCYAVRDDQGALVGFFEFHRDGDTLDIGLGLRPDLTGQGLGLSFVLSGLDFARHEFSPARFRLSVAAFNERAIRVYERAGFVLTRRSRRVMDGAVVSFLEMVRDAIAP